MKRICMRVIAMVFSGVFLLSCHKDEGPKQCSAGPSAGTAPANGIVKYTVSVTGSGTVSSVIYQGSAGAVSVANPSLPFTVTDSVKLGGALSITALGNTTGKITAGYAFQDGAHDFSDQGECGP